MLQFSFDPFPQLHSERLLLRRMHAGDAAGLFPYRSDAAVMRYIPRKRATSIEDAEALIALMDDRMNKSEMVNWGIFYKETGELLGTIGFVKLYPDNHRAEVGYLVGPQVQGKGIASEALRTVLHHGFTEMGLNSVEAIIHPQNIPSIKLAERTGFTRAGYLRDYNLLDGVYADATLYELLAREFKGLHERQS